MRDVVLVLRGLWSRRRTAAAVLVVSALVVAAAATGPLFLRAADESVLRDTVRQTAPPGRILGNSLDLPLGRDPLRLITRLETAKLRPLHTLHGVVGPPIRSLEVPTQVGPTGGSSSNTKLVHRDGLREHVRMVTGRCPTSAGEVVISAPTSDTTGWRAGRRLAVGGRPVTVVGTYVPLDLGGDYWSGHVYFQSQQGSGGGSGLDAVFAPLRTVQAQDPTLLSTATVDRHVDPARLRLTAVPRLQAQVSSYDVGRFPPTSGETSVVEVATALPAALRGALSTVDSLRVPVVVVTAQLLVLCWLVLFLVVANSAEARGPEVALAKLRGVPAPVTLAFAVAESLLLVAAAVPIGSGLAWLWVSGLAHAQLAPGTPVAMTRYAALAALAAGLGAAGAAVLAAWSTLRRPVVDQWRRADRDSRPRSWWVDVVVVAVVVPGAALLLRGGGANGGGGGGGGAAGVLTLAAPGLMVLGVAMVASRALPALCRAAFTRTRRRRSTAVFLAVRQVARRPSTLRQALVLGVAFGLVTFAVSAWTVARANAHDRAWTETGAAQVLTVYASDRQDVAALVDRLDPSGRLATTVSTVTDFQGSPPRGLLAVEPSRFAHVAFWRPDFAPEPLVTLVRRLGVRTAPSVPLTGDRVSVDVRTTRSLQALHLVADVAVPAAGLQPVDLGALTRGRVRAPLVCATQPCRLAGFHLERPGTGSAPATGSLTVRRVEVHDARGWHEVGAGLTRTSSWRGADGARPTGTTSGLRVAVRAGALDQPAWTVADVPDRVPALVSPADGPGGTASGLDTERLRLRVVGRGPVLPDAGDAGVIVSRPLALRASNGSESVAQDTVWLAPGASPAFTQRLTRAGVTVLDRQDAAGLTAYYQRQGPALALLLFVAVAGLGAVLAAGGTVLSLHLAGRRRSYEIASMRAIGVPRRTLVRAVVVEQGLLLSFGLVVGVVSGWVAARLTLPTVPEFADTPTAPPLRYDVPPGPLLAVVALAALVLTLVVLVTATRLVRGAEFEQLREAPA